MILLALLASYWGVYQHGRAVERAEAVQASAERDSGDRLAEVIGERGARQEEQRRAQAQEEIPSTAASRCSEQDLQFQNRCIYRTAQTPSDLDCHLLTPVAYRYLHGA